MRWTSKSSVAWLALVTGCSSAVEAPPPPPPPRPVVLAVASATPATTATTSSSSPAPSALALAIPPPLTIPVGEGEELIGPIPLPSEVGPLPLHIDHPGVVLLGYAIGVDLSWTGTTVDGLVQLDLTGPGIQEHLADVRVNEPKRILFKARPTTAGEHRVTARAGSLGERVLSFHVVSAGMFANPIHVPIEGDYQLVARGFVRGRVGAHEIQLQRGRFDAKDRTLTVDISATVEEGPALAKVVAALGKPRKVGKLTLYVKDVDDRKEAIWLSRSGTTPDTTVLRVNAPSLDAAELQVVTSYVARYPPLPAPLQVLPAAPKRCTATLRQCCLPDGRAFPFAGCQAGPADDMVIAPYSRGPDGFCKPVPCNKR